jgi:hypothetical protein
MIDEPDDSAPTPRRAPDDEVRAWRDDGWTLLERLIPVEDIDAAVGDLWKVVPTPEAFHAEPEAEKERWLGRPPASRDEFRWPSEGPGFRPEQHRFRSEFPFPGSGALNRICVHPAIVDFAERALGTSQVRIYQARVSAKYAGDANYEQPMHTDRNHSWLPAGTKPPWWNLQLFVYLCDVHAGNAPTRVVPLAGSEGRPTTIWGVMPNQDGELYQRERAAPGVRGSVLAYRSNVFHRGVDLSEPTSARFLLGVSFKDARAEWIGFDALQTSATSPHWVSFVEASSARELALFGFPAPGHPIWDEALLEQTADRYPKLDLTPWRAALPTTHTAP